ncbi:MAG: hypothetical protein A2233_02455 [Candidatus Kerfeldbacteria bacterium RIFOXYA2_FULL_38_24]|uniref:Uncharacterized protein n=1 Tax=Candidatus Kerfeldbacteria bacterium RIFOXYB2_FULL_38_14 TaxID=1798547 RepID=A0A1G2B9F4_9BACT|nr:MAG: hypothetical protein A2233_02455 [Candidatus Kerfeldbacteria bacterium RIFOXYA2_FULL_38_24]OGY85843.1 MAG: hypothetical protein A2319_05815 [Candidatus Kerfeldbacteria bacterium RIFOXYB2_FULL_38_14]OGY89118.1 MAG: hypothetical protein A2458_02565 [Candidatus Kerfeldbacteria bacterium RIFOXYC2_FULL_38_9]
METPVKKSAISKISRGFLLATVTGLVLNILAWALLLWKIPYTEEVVFLHYNIFYGVDLVGNWRQLFLVPGTGLFILVINILCIFYFKKMSREIFGILLVMTLLLEVFLFISAFLLVLLNN